MGMRADIVAVNSTFARRQAIAEGDFVALSSPDHSSPAVCILQASVLELNCDMLIHPIIHDYLIENWECQLGEAEEDDVSTARVRRFPPHYGDTDAPSVTCRVSKVEPSELPECAVINVQIVYCEPPLRSEIQEVLSLGLVEALSGRVVMNDSMLLLNVADSTILSQVLHLKGLESNEKMYRVGDAVNVEHSVLVQNDCVPGDFLELEEFETDCPGYEDFLNKVIVLLEERHVASPTGVLLTGCSGAGKSRLASCVASHLSQNGWLVRRISTQTLILRASSASREDMLEAIMLPVSSTCQKVAWIVDDLHIMEGVDDSYKDAEMDLVFNSLLETIDFAVQRGQPVLAIAHSSSNLRQGLLKASRLEKVIELLPPTQFQRELILEFLLANMGISPNFSKVWAEQLSPLTAGCVASDLTRICNDALNNVWVRRGTEELLPLLDDLLESARSCIPSQLALLDVRKPFTFHGEVARDDWAGCHQISWRPFAGYSNVKKRIFRTVVVPWRRHLDACENVGPISSTGNISPPTGVLFHGASGCGKSLAAVCLVASLGLPMIHVRAADVLDKWLGGSEAALRALFARARAASPAILFFDEIDAIASNRSQSGETTDVMSRILSTFLNEMDGVSSNSRGGVLVVACTNRVESLDAALLRPGRLEEHILLAKPSEPDALAILEQKLTKVECDNDIDIAYIAREMYLAGASCADIEGIAKEAILRATRDFGKRDVRLAKNHIYEAIESLRFSIVY